MTLTSGPKRSTPSHITACKEDVLIQRRPIGNCLLVHRCRSSTERASTAAATAAYDVDSVQRGHPLSFRYGCPSDRVDRQRQHCCGATDLGAWQMGSSSRGRCGAAIHRHRRAGRTLRGLRLSGCGAGRVKQCACNRGPWGERSACPRSPSPSSPCSPYARRTVFVLPAQTQDHELSLDPPRFLNLRAANGAKLHEPL